jgi:hypothetical protein
VGKLGVGIGSVGVGTGSVGVGTGSVGVGMGSVGVGPGIDVLGVGNGPEALGEGDVDPPGDGRGLVDADPDAWSPLASRTTSGVSGASRAGLSAR